MWRDKIVCMVVLAFVFSLVVESQERYLYCQKCGLKRDVHSYGIDRHPVWAWSTTYRTSTYHNLYRKLVSPQCNHQWGTYSYGWATIIPISAGVGCGSSPRVLRHDEEIKQLSHLHNRAQAGAVLKSLDLTKSESSHNRDVLESLAELEGVDSTIEQQQWWKAHRNLFQSSRK